MRHKARRKAAKRQSGAICAFWTALIVTGALVFGSAARAAEPASCATVRLAETGWTDIAATTALAEQALQALGYQTESRLLSVPVALSALSSADIDVFLGLWRPSMNTDIAPYLQDKSAEIIRANLRGARYGLAVPRYAYDAGLRSVADIARFRAALGGTLYGVEPGNDGNRIALALIDNPANGLSGFQLAESSEQAMLAELAAAIEEKRPIVFLAWEPHPMNAQFPIAYLSGTEAAFGSAAEVDTVARQGYAEQCPNIGRFLRNLSFSMDAEESLMQAILTKGEEPQAAARAWLKANPQILAEWLEGVTAQNGEAALPAAQRFFAAP